MAYLNSTATNPLQYVIQTEGTVYSIIYNFAEDHSFKWSVLSLVLGTFIALCGGYIVRPLLMGILFSQVFAFVAGFGYALISAIPGDSLIYFKLAVLILSVMISFGLANLIRGMSEKIGIFLLYSCTIFAFLLDLSLFIPPIDAMTSSQTNQVFLAFFGLAPALIAAIEAPAYDFKYFPFVILNCSLIYFILYQLFYPAGDDLVWTAELFYQSCFLAIILIIGAVIYVLCQRAMPKIFKIIFILSDKFAIFVGMLVIGVIISRSFLDLFAVDMRKSISSIFIIVCAIEAMLATVYIYITRRYTGKYLVSVTAFLGAAICMYSWSGILGNRPAVFDIANNFATPHKWRIFYAIQTISFAVLCGMLQHKAFSSKAQTEVPQSKPEDSNANLPLYAHTPRSNNRFSTYGSTDSRNGSSATSSSYASGTASMLAQQAMMNVSLHDD